MLINLRNALMAGKRIPYDAEVEYLESTGTQWIDTGITPDALDLSVELTLLSKGGHVFGCRNSSNLVSGNIWSAYSNNATSMREDWLLSSSTFAISSTVPNTVTFSSTTNGSSISYDGQTYTGNAKTTYSYSMVLFGVSTAGVVSTGKMVIYACKIWKSGVLVRDFIPVRKGAVGYLYDRVSGKLFGNAGTGDFVLGQDVVPVEYIESHGTEWIDTGVAFADNFKWAVDFNGLDVQKTIFGGRASTTRTSLLYRYSSSEVVINVAQYSSTTTPFKLGNIASGRHCVECAINQNVGNVWLDGVQVYTNEVIAGTYISGVSQALFADNFGSYVLEQASSKLYKCQMWQSGTLVRSFLPVRVGTEGATMDVLTRRIYRNAGTGAFSYGNDLKYPIPSE